MNLSRRNFLASIPALAALIGLKANPELEKRPLASRIDCKWKRGHGTLECEGNVRAGQMVFIGGHGKVTGIPNGNPIGICIGNSSLSNHAIIQIS